MNNKIAFTEHVFTGALFRVARDLNLNWQKVHLHSNLFIFNFSCFSWKLQNKIVINLCQTTAKQPARISTW